VGQLKMQMDETSIVYIRRLRKEEIESFTEDLRLLLPLDPQKCELFCVAPNKLRSMGILLRCGRWQDNNFVERNGIHMLILHDNIPVDLHCLCRGMLTVPQESEMQREFKNRAKKTYEELIEDAQKRIREEESKRLAGTRAGSLDSFVVENRVINSDEAVIFAKWFGASDSSELEGCHCTLRSLHLVNTMLCDKGCEILSSCLSRNQLLRSINFGHNNIGDLGCAALFKASVGRNLAVLKLGGNILGDKGCAMIPAMLESVPLVELHLHNNLIGDEGVRSIAQGLGLNQSLRVLNLNANRIRDTGTENLAAVLMLKGGKHNDVLGAVNYMSRTLGIVPAGSIRRKSYTTNTTLGSLHLSSNFLSDTVAGQIADIIQANCSLTNIELASNRIGDVGAKNLAEALKVPYLDKEGNKVGRNLILNCNNIGGSGIIALMRAVKMSGQVHTLGVEGMKVAMTHRTVIQENSAATPQVQFTGNRTVPRIRLEAIHSERKVTDIAAKVAEEFGPTRKAKFSGLIKDSLFPIDRFMQDHLDTYKYQSGWGINEGGSTTRGNSARPSTFEKFNTSASGAHTARLSTQSSHTSAMGYTSYLMHDMQGVELLKIDEDPEFQELCNRFKVPVHDKMRTKLKELNEKQREQRAKIYDRLLETQTKFHRPITRSVVQVQSVFRMKKSVRLAAVVRQKNQDEFECMATVAQHDLAQDYAKGAASILVSAAPGKRRYFSHWHEVTSECNQRKEDIFTMFSTYCTRMGVSACGTNMLRSFVNNPCIEHLSLKGIGLTTFTARALSFIFMGVENCRLCRGTGTMSGDVFKNLSKDPMSDHITSVSAFKAVDLDGSNSIDASELLIAFRHLGLNLRLEEVQAVMNTIDKDKSGSIDQDEFQALFQSMSTDKGPAECVLCNGKGHTNRPCILEEPWNRHVKPLLEIRQSLDYSLIKELELSDNCLRSNGAKDIVNIVIRCGPLLRTLRVARNELGDDGATVIAALFCNEELQVAECDLSGNNIGDSGMRSIAEAVQGSKTIQVLNLASNSCTGSGCHVFREMLSYNESLTELDISWNGIGGEQASAFWQGVENSLSLTRLHAHWNGFCDLKACQALCTALQENTTLKYLDLSHNRITEECCKVISEGFARNEDLIQFRLDGNPLGVHGAKALLSAAQMGSKYSDYGRTVRMENCSSVGVLDMSMFDPNQPEGRYMLDMQDESARQVLRNVLRLVAQGRITIEKMVIGEGLTSGTKTPYALKCFMTQEQFRERGMADSDPMKWEMPEVGGLEFNVQKVATTEKKAHGLSIDKWDSFCLRCMTNVKTYQQKIVELEMVLSGSMSRAKFKAIFDILNAVHQDDGCLALAQAFWNRVEGDLCGRSVVAILSEVQRRKFYKALNIPTFQYCKNNPSGYYHLNLEIPEERQLVFLLLEAKASQAGLENTLKEYSEGRHGGLRDVSLIENRSWRNFHLDAEPYQFKRGWRVPTSGVLTLDFVKITKPDVEDPSVHAMSEGYFKSLIQEISAEGMTPIKILESIKSTSNNRYFLCSYVVEIMRFFQIVDAKAFFQPRVELLVTVFGRTIDWMGLTNIYNILLPFERKLLGYRLGEENIFAEAMAVNFYELDLAEAAQRYVMQELLHIAVLEDGENVVELQYQGCDYKIPASWISDVPRSGTISPLKSFVSTRSGMYE
jgi:Ran GTPase-activating protein (RanGAP) involved in mRNA processing and transport